MNRAAQLLVIWLLDLFMACRDTLHACIYLWQVINLATEASMICCQDPRKMVENLACWVPWLQIDQLVGFVSTILAKYLIDKGYDV